MRRETSALYLPASLKPLFPRLSSPQRTLRHSFSANGTSPIIPPLARRLRKPNDSRTYADPRGEWGYTSLISPTRFLTLFREKCTLSAFFLFKHLRTLSFSGSHSTPFPPSASALFCKNRGRGTLSIFQFRFSSFDPPASEGGPCTFLFGTRSTSHGSRARR